MIASLLAAALIVAPPPKAPQVYEVPLPYAGPLLLEFEPAANGADGGRWLFAFPDAAAGMSLACDNVGFPFTTTLAEAPLPLTACETFSKAGRGSLRIVDDLLVVALDVTDAEAYRLEFSAAGFDGFRFQTTGTQPAPQTPGGPTSQPGDVTQCPGGSCSCTGPIGVASACCPAGFTAQCRCTSAVSSGTCVQVNPPPRPIPPGGATPAPGVRGAVPDLTIIGSQRLDGGAWVDSLYDVTPGDCE